MAQQAQPVRVSKRSKGSVQFVAEFYASVPLTRSTEYQLPPGIRARYRIHANR